MKINGRIILVLGLLPSMLFARFINSIGTKCAYTSSNIYHGLMDDCLSRRSGFNIALFCEFGSFKYFSVVTQIEYAQKGFIEEMKEADETGDIIQHLDGNTRLDYLSVPLLLKIKYPKAKFVPYLVLGPRFDYLINTKNGVWEFTEIDIKSTTADKLDKEVFGGSIGAGFNLAKLSCLQTFIELRYNFDFSDSYSWTNNVTVRNNSFDFWLGIAF